MSHQTAAQISNNPRDGDEQAKDGDDESECEFQDDYWEEIFTNWEELEIDENSVLWWEEDGEIHHWFECPYTVSAMNQFRKDDPRCLYGKMTVHELRQAVQDRGLPDPYPQGLTMKYFYVRTLQAADRDAGFRFLDLPPEMRNLVYTELLTFQYARCSCCTSTYCFPAILRTCRQVHQEASDIIYAENEITCVFEVDMYNTYESKLHARVHASKYGGKDAKLFAHYEKAISLYPAFLQKAHKLKIRISLHGSEGVERACEGIRQCMMGIASFLMDAHRIKTISIFLCNQLGADQEAVENMLYPLRRLRSISGTVGLPHVLSDECKRDMAIEMQSSTAPTFNTLRHLQSLKAEAEAFLKAMTICNPSLWDDFDSEDEGPDLSDLQGRIKHLMSLLYTGYPHMYSDEDPFSSPEEEENTRRLMRDLCSALGRVDIAACMKKMKAFSRIRKGRETFLAEHPWADVPDKPEDAAIGRTTMARDRILDDSDSE